MILRRLSRHVSEQNWTAVILDFVVVVVGVFIAIQVANWNDAAADRRTEAAILSAISDDIARERRELANGREFALLSLRAGNMALQSAGESPVVAVSLAVDDVGALSEDALDLAALAAEPLDEGVSVWTPITVRYFPTSSSVAFDTLINSGDLDLISNERLARRLQLYRQLWLGLEQSQLSTYREFRNRLTFAGQDAGLSPFSNVGAGELAALLAARPPLRAALLTSQEYTILHVSQMEMLDTEAAALLAMIDAESR